MTESEKIAYAKTFIDKMANGINPLNNMPARAEDLINQVRISRCLFYVSEILGRAIDAESKREAREHKKKVKTRAKNRAPFTITAEQLLAFSYTELPLSITAFTKKVNFLVWQELEASRMKRLNYRQIIAWMLKTGLLEYRETAVGVFRGV